MNRSVQISTDYLLHLLYGSATGQVHSVYRKTINIQTGDFLFALQSDCSPISPISMITSLTETELAALPVQEGDIVSISNNHLTILHENCTLCFDYSDCTILPAFPQGTLTASQLSLIQNAICSSHTGGFRNFPQQRQILG